jgi:hypothetical protein
LTVVLHGAFVLNCDLVVLLSLHLLHLSNPIESSPWSRLRRGRGRRGFITEAHDSGNPT